MNTSSKSWVMATDPVWLEKCSGVRPLQSLQFTLAPCFISISTVYKTFKQTFNQHENVSLSSANICEGLALAIPIFAQIAHLWSFGIYSL